jgi:hypothetical protein
MNAIEVIKSHLRESAMVKQQLARAVALAIAEAGQRIAERVCQRRQDHALWQRR